MKIFLWYAGIITTLTVAAVCWVLAKARAEAPGDATLDGLIIVPIALFLILAGYASLILWRKFIGHDGTVSTFAWVSSGIFIFIVLYPIVSNLIKAILPSSNPYD